MPTEVEVGRGADDRSRVAAVVRRTLATEGRTPATVSVAFVDPGAMRSLNRRHRGADRPTDVLSFPFGSEFPQGSGGEVVLCLAEAERTAARQGRPLAETVDRLVVHGVLHLLGYRDDTPGGLDEMERRTDRILADG